MGGDLGAGGFLRGLGGGRGGRPSECPGDRLGSAGSRSVDHRAVVGDHQSELGGVVPGVVEGLLEGFDLVDQTGD